MQTLDTLGAGFSWLPMIWISGAQKFAGDEQSGHVRESEIELYQDMLKQAVEIAKKSREEEAVESQSEEQDWSPQISLGTNVLIPEAYVPDLSVRLSLSANWCIKEQRRYF